MQNNLPTVITLLLLCFFATDLQAAITGDRDNRAREIFEEIDDRRNALTYETSKLEMLIIDSRERTRTRGLKMYSYASGETTKSLAVFEAPADIRGTGLLSLSEAGTQVQYLYLPAVGRVQTVSGSQRTERFMGSDFTYEDLGNLNPDDYEFELIKDEQDEIEIKAVPGNESQYAYIHFHIHPEKMTLTSARYFNERDEQIKELRAGEFKEVKSGIWRPDLMIMKDLKENRRTELRWSERKFDESIPDRYFTERHLQRGLQ